MYAHATHRDGWRTRYGCDGGARSSERNSNGDETRRAERHDYTNSLYLQRRLAPVVVGSWHWTLVRKVAVAPSELIDYDRDRDPGCDRVNVQRVEQRYPQSRAMPPLTLSPCGVCEQLDQEFKRRTRRTGAAPRTGEGVAEPGKLRSGDSVVMRHTASRRRYQWKDVPRVSFTGRMRKRKIKDQVAKEATESRSTFWGKQ